MTGEPREIRDILAESMRRERLGLVRPLWLDWCAFDNEGGPEQWRLRADHLMRLLKELGLSIVRTGFDVPSRPSPQSDVIYRFKLHGREAERVIRKAAGDDWQVAVIDKDGEKVEQTFTIEQASINGGLVLMDHPDMKTIPRLGLQLAALNEIYRVGAEAMEPAP